MPCAHCVTPQVSLVTLDLSFISVLKVMPALAGVMAPGTQMVVLIKPQFEAGRAQVGAGGLVKDPQVSWLGWCVGRRLHAVCAALGAECLRCCRWRLRRCMRK